MNVPKLRFKEFDGEWRRYNLSSIVNLLGGNAFSSADSVSEGIKWLKIANVGFGKVMWNNKDFLPYSFQSQYAKYLLEEEDIVLTLTRPILNGKLKIASLNKRDTPSLLNQRVAKIEVKNDITSKEFLFHLLQNRRTVLDIEKSISGTDPPNLGNKELKKIEVDIPFLEEGNKVAVFLNKLSEKIQLQQQKIDLLQEQKKGFLQKMFPKAGETQPEMRFKGYKDNWKQKKLEEVTSRVKGNDGRMGLPTLTISASQGWLDQRERFSANIAGKEQKNYTLLKKGQLSYNHGNSKLAKYGVVFELDAYEEALVPRVYHSFETNNLADSKFIQYMFETKRTDKELAKLISSGARMDGLLNINYDEFMGITVSIPDIKEQKKIAEFFIMLNEKINREKEKVRELEKQKQGFMQQMFI